MKRLLYKGRVKYWWTTFSWLQRQREVESTRKYKVSLGAECFHIKKQTQSHVEDSHPGHQTYERDIPRDSRGKSTSDGAARAPRGISSNECPACSQWRSGKRTGGSTVESVKPPRRRYRKSACHPSRRLQWSLAKVTC